MSDKKLKEAIEAGDRFRIAKEFRTGNDEIDRAWWNKEGKKLTDISYRDTKAAARLVDFLDEQAIGTEDL